MKTKAICAATLLLFGGLLATGPASANELLPKITIHQHEFDAGSVVPKAVHPIQGGFAGTFTAFQQDANDPQVVAIGQMPFSIEGDISLDDALELVAEIACDHFQYCED